MGQILHPRARTTKEVRQEIQKSPKSIAYLAQFYGLNPKTIFKWRKRNFVHDLPMGPKNPRSTVLTQAEEALIVSFRRYTLLPLDDCLYSLQDVIPHLTRSSLHRCFQRHRISCLPKNKISKPSKQKFKKYPIGYFHMDVAEARTEEGKLYLFVAIDRTSKLTFVQLHNRQTVKVAVQFLKDLIKAIPYKIHTLLTDNGRQFTHLKTDKYVSKHLFDSICKKEDIEHRLTKVNHPWTNGQVERMNRTIKEATIHRYHYDSHQQLRKHLSHFLNAYNFAKRLKSLKGATPYEAVLSWWTKEPERFKINPHLYTSGLYTYLLYSTL